MRAVGQQQLKVSYNSSLRPHTYLGEPRYMRAVGQDDAKGLLDLDLLAALAALTDLTPATVVVSVAPPAPLASRAAAAVGVSVAARALVFKSLAPVHAGARRVCIDSGCSASALLTRCLLCFPHL